MTPAPCGAVLTKGIVTLEYTRGSGVAASGPRIALLLEIRPKH